MKRPISIVLGVAGVAALIWACASDRTANPTLNDYSDSVASFIERWFEAVSARQQPVATYAQSFRGTLPGVSGNARQADLGAIQISLESASPAGSESADAARFAHALDSLLAAAFKSITRQKADILAFDRKGPDREITLRLFWAGEDPCSWRRQETGLWRARLTPAARGDGAWEFAEIRQLEWLSASSEKPLFEEVSEKAGLTDVHRAALPNAARNLPIPGEHLPPGVAVLDLDGDGLDDLLVVGGWGNRLYQNHGDGTFSDVAEKAGVVGWKGREATGALAFDYDNDGKIDLYATYLDGPNLLFHNRGDGTFEQAGERAGLALKDWCTSAAAFDYDRDGFADVYVLSYGRPEYGPNIQANNAERNHLFHNNGDGTFSDVSKAAGVADRGWGLALSPLDTDEDGWPDLYIANDFGVNVLYRNNRDGSFTNIARRAGVTDAGFGMGVAVADYDGDGHLDFYVSNYSYPQNWLLRDPRYPMPAFPYNLGRPLVWRRLQAMSRGSSLFHWVAPGRYVRTSNEAGVWDTSWSWGCQFLDARLSGRPNLFVVNGMVTGTKPAEHEVEFWNLMSREFKKFEKGIPIMDFGDDSLWGHLPKRFYVNLDGRRFAELAAIAGLESDGNERGLVVLDANGDGAPDLFAGGFLQKPQLWVNKNPDGNRALVVKLVGNAPAQRGVGGQGPGVGSGSVARRPSPVARPYRSTRDALGAVVRVEVAGLPPQTQILVAGNSFLSSSTKALYFGLGKKERADRVTVRWPSGKVTMRENVPAGQLTVVEAEAPASSRGPKGRGDLGGRSGGPSAHPPEIASSLRSSR